MPYQIRKVGAKYCLYVKASGKRVGCHDTKAGAEAQRRAIESSKHSHRSLVLRVSDAELRTAQFEDRDHVVLPVVAMVEGVIWPINAPKPEMVPAASFAAIPGGWNGRPVFCDVGIGHPTDEDGEPVTGNTPRTLEHAIGTVFNAKTDGKRLLMEAWLDPSRPGAQEVIDRVKAGKSVEVSVGAYVIAEPSRGQFGSKYYDSIWREIIPDHLAILPEGEEGACSVAMGCGIRSAVHTIKDGVFEFDGEVHVDAEQKLIAAITNARKDGDQFKELHLFGDGVAVFETAAGKMYRQGYEIGADGAVTFGDLLEVEPVVYYEPVDLKAAKGARHSAADMGRIQAMHNYTVELGAQCSPTAAASKPCGCQKQKEKNMARTKEQREELVKSLRTKIKSEIVTKLEALAKGSGDIIDAIVAQIKEKLGLSDAAAADIANLDEATLVELAGFSMPADPNANPDKPAGDGQPPAPVANKAKTEEEFLADAPQSVKDLVADAKARDEARRTELVTAIGKVTKEYTETELKGKSVKELERLARACKVNAKPVDFSVNAPRPEENQEQPAAPEPINLQERIRAARGKK